MKRVTWIIILSIIFLVPLVGCQSLSMRYTSTLKPSPDPEYHLGSIKFNIVSSPYSLDYGIPMGPSTAPRKILSSDIIPQRYWTSTDSAELSQVLMPIAERMYPNLFSRDPMSLPLGVDIHANMSSTCILTVIGSLTIPGCLTFFPVPGSEESDYKVETTILLKNYDKALPLKSVSFQRRDCSWMTMASPLGLIPIPGNTDIPKTSGINSPKWRESGDKYSMMCCVEAIAQSIKASEKQILEYIPDQQAQ